MIAIIKKELKSYFLSPIGWIYIGIFLIFCSLFFFTDIFRYKSSTFSDLFGITVSVLSVLIPILTMRTFAEERKNKTDQILLTAPISVREIVLGKFIGASIVVIINICILFYINVFWKARIYNNNKCINWLHFIIISIYIYWTILL